MFPFKLSLKSAVWGAEYGKRYGSAFTDKEVEEFAETVKAYILNNEKDKISDLVNYPISVKINGQDVKISNETDFIKNYDNIFHTKLKNTIAKSYTKYMFTNWRGIMLGDDGAIWFNNIHFQNSKPKLLITAINN